MSESNPDTAQAVTEQILGTQQRDIEIVGDAIREVSESTTRELKQHKTNLLQAFGVIVTVLIAFAGLLLNEITTNSERITEVSSRLQEHEVQAAYNRGLTEGKLNELSKDINELKERDSEIIDSLVQEFHGGSQR